MLDTTKLKDRLMSYVLALVAVGVGVLLRIVITYYTGPSLATYVTIYPAVIFAAVLGGLGPGLLATVASVFIVDYYFLSPKGLLAFKSLADLAGIVLFIIMGVLISLVIELYRRNQQKNNIYNRSLLEASLDPLVTISREGNITDVNEATVKITGLAKEELIDTDFSDYFTEPEKVREGYMQVFVKGFVADYPLTIKAKDGKQTDVLYNAAIYKDNKGNVLGVIAVARDITEQKKITEELKESYATLEQKVRDRTQDLEVEKKNVEEAKAKDEVYLSSIGDGIVIINEDGNVLRINQAAEEMLGRKDLIGRIFGWEIKLMDKEGKELSKEERPIHQVFETGKKATYTNYSYLKNDGTKLPIALTTAPVIVNGKITGAVDVFRDITKEREIDKAKTEFVSLASHQLRTPLSAINWYAEMLLAGDVGKITPEQKKYLQEIYKGNQRMVDLVNALLDVSRIELGTFSIEPKPTDLKEISQSLINEMQAQIKKKAIKISEIYDPKISKINADPKLIRIVLQNLISNAVKYTPEKGQVAVSLTKDDPNVLIKISDTGYGIPKAQQSHIFEKLFRADNVREKDTEGTGLGLYLVKAITEQSGGKVRFESAENKGTTFFVSIPLTGMKKKEGTKALEDIK